MRDTFDFQAVYKPIFYFPYCLWFWKHVEETMFFSLKHCWNILKRQIHKSTYFAQEGWELSANRTLIHRSLNISSYMVSCCFTFAQAMSEDYKTSNFPRKQGSTTAWSKPLPIHPFYIQMPSLYRWMVLNKTFDNNLLLIPAYMVCHLSGYISACIHWELFYFHFT